MMCGGVEIGRWEIEVLIFGSTNSRTKAMAMAMADVVVSLCLPLRDVGLRRWLRVGICGVW